MLTKTYSSAAAGSGFPSRASDERDVRETHSSRVWRDELAEMLEANLRHLDAMKGFRRSTHASGLSVLRQL